MEFLLLGFFTGLSLILAIGAQNIFVIEQGLKKNHAFLVCLICSLSDLILIFAGIFLFHYFTQYFNSIIELTYNVLLIIFLVHFIYSKIKSHNSEVNFKSELKDISKFRLYMGITLLCSFIFLVIKYFEYTAKFDAGHYPSTHNFYAVYFTITGLHMLHIIGGIIVNGYFWLPGSKMWETEPERFTNRIEVAGLYWHFVDLVWIFVFPSIYLL